MKPSNEILYKKVSDDIKKKNKVNSAYRSMMIIKSYKEKGGGFDGQKNKNSPLKNWIKNEWLSVNDYYKGKIVKCGDSKIKKVLCKPKSIIDIMTKPEMKKLIDAKSKISKNKNLRSEDILKTKRFNVK